jgi:hypothetical protein
MVIKRIKIKIKIKKKNRKHERKRSRSPRRSRSPNDRRHRSPTPPTLPSGKRRDVNSELHQLAKTLSRQTHAKENLSAAKTNRREKSPELTPEERDLRTVFCKNKFLLFHQRSLELPAVSHIPNFGDAATGSADGYLSARRVRVRKFLDMMNWVQKSWTQRALPARDATLSPNFGICDTT